MGRIYSQADTTLAWLGKASQDSNLAMDALECLGKLTSDTSLESDASTESSASVTSDTSCTCVSFIPWSDIPHKYVAKDMSEEPYNSTWVSLKSLFKRAYWSRAWTFQETVIPKWTLLMCGSASCELHYALDAEHWLSYNGEGSCPMDIDPSVWACIKEAIRLDLGVLGSIRRAHFSFHAKAFGFDKDPYQWRLLLESQGREAKVAHDAIYAFLAVSRLPIKVDYLKSLNQLFLDVARLGVEIEDLETVLYFATEVENSQPQPTAISWVPQWSPPKKGCAADFIAPFNYIYSANKGSLVSKAAFVNEVGQLTLFGKSCDIVRHIGPTSLPFHISDQLRDILDHYKMLSPYAMHLPFLQAVIRTLMCDQNGQHARLHATGSRNHEIFLKVIIYAFIGIRKSKVEPTENVISSDKQLFGLPMDKHFGYFYAKEILGDSSHKITAKGHLEIMLPLLEALEQAKGVEDEFASYLSRLSYKTRFFFTSQGYLGTAPSCIEVGDKVIVSNHCRVPLLLRKCGLAYKFVGPCFVLGMMDGEAFQNNRDVEDLVVG